MKKSAKFFGKSLLALALGIIAVAGLAVAGLLSYYGRVVGTVTVNQSLVISSDGSIWKECTRGDYSQCTVTYSGITAIAGNEQDFNNTFYLKNNANPTSGWDYVNFTWEYTIPENLLDGLTVMKVYYTTYQSTENDPGVCDKFATMSLTKGTGAGVWNCNNGWCTLQVPDSLGEGMIQKFCGMRIGLKPNTIPDTYSLNINIVPA
jgi:Ca2+-binding RTX toxin-like protein